jgi:hypothetical protein
MLIAKGTENINKELITPKTKYLKIKEVFII